jgi:hypothetical protein
VGLVAAVALAAAPAVPAADGTSVPLEQDDAGTGRDAGRTVSTAIPVDLGTGYDGTLLPGGAGATGDDDWYEVILEAGQHVRATLDHSGPPGLEAHCLRIRDEDGEVLADARCSRQLDFEAPRAGTYILDVSYFVVVPSEYSFRLDDVR